MELLANITRFNNLMTNYYLDCLANLGLKKLIDSDYSLNYKHAKYNVKKLSDLITSGEFCPNFTRNVCQMLNNPNSHADLGNKEVKLFDGIKVSIINDKKLKDQKTIIYLSGGAFIMSSIDTYQVQKSLFTISERLNCRIITIGHDNSPEVKLTEQVDQSLRVYKYILNNNIASINNIVVMGDSSGGNIASLMVNKALKEKLPMPKGLVLVSPYIDTECKNINPEMFKKDVVMGKYINREFINGWFKENVVGDYNFNSPRVNPMHANWQGMPKTFIIVGENEIILESIKDFIKKHKNKCELELFVGVNMMHIYPLLTEYFPEAIEGMGIVIYKIKEFFNN